MDASHTQYLNKKCTLAYTDDQYHMIFFLISKSEHDNEDVDRTFLTKEGGSVFLYCQALSYDWKERGCTTSLMGHTTHNDGKAEWGDIYPLLKKFQKLGGPDLASEAKMCASSKSKAAAFSKRIESLPPKEAALYTLAEIKVIGSKHGYLRHAVDAWRSLGIEPRPLSVVAVFDAALNQGLGGQWDPCAWLKKHGTKGDEDASLKAFNRWRRVAATKNHHNDPPSNGERRSDMFETLRDQGAWDLPRKACTKAVHWTMK